MLTKKLTALVLFVFAVPILLSACQAKTQPVEITRIVTVKETVIETVVEKVVEKETITETVVEKQTVVRKETVVQLVTSTPVPQPEKERVLVICMGQEPATLFIPAAQMVVTGSVLEAVYDGPIDSRSFSYQPVILEKLPSLADGDALIETVTVAAGDLVVNADGEPVTLEEGVALRPAGCYNPDCAVQFDGTPVEMEQMIVTFKLIEGLTWSDGEPLTAHDSVYGFELSCEPEIPHGTYMQNRTTSYEALDDYTTVWTGLPGFRDSLYFINFWNPFPEHAWSDLSALELVEAERSSRKPLGWGPYVIEEWVTGDHIRLRKNELYWRADEGLPRFDTVIYRFKGEDSNANIAALLSGECDIVDQSSQLDDQVELLLKLQAVEQVNAVLVTGTTFEFAGFGIDPVESYDRPDFFEDARTRRAVAYCMDRQAVIDTVLFGQSLVLDTYLSPVHPLSNTKVPHYPFDVEKGTALLEEVGWIDDDGDPQTPRVAQGVEGIPDGTLLAFNYWTTTAPQRQQATQVLQDSLAECGVQISLEYINPSEFFSIGAEGLVFGRRFDMIQFGVPTGVDPPCGGFLSSQIPGEHNAWSGGNIWGWRNEAYDAACGAALQSLPGTPEYVQFHMEAQQIFAEQLPILPLYLRTKLAATRPDMRGFIIDPTQATEFWNIEEFDY